MNFRQRNYEAMVSKGMPELLAACAANKNSTIKVNEAVLMREKPSDILWGLFTWASTSEGHDFWYDMAEDLRNHKL